MASFTASTSRGVNISFDSEDKTANMWQEVGWTDDGYIDLCTYNFVTKELTKGEYYYDGAEETIFKFARIVKTVAEMLPEVMEETP